MAQAIAAILGKNTGLNIFIPVEGMTIDERSSFNDDMRMFI